MNGNPMRHTFPDCCARAASGQKAVAPPSSVMNSRRLTPDTLVPAVSGLAVYGTRNLAKRGRKVCWPDAKCAESNRVEHCASPTKDTTRHDTGGDGCNAGFSAPSPSAAGHETFARGAVPIHHAIVGSGQNKNPANWH